MFRSKEKQLNEFAILLGKLDGAQLMGLTRMLQVKVFTEQEKNEKEHLVPREATEVIEECLVKFDGLNKRNRNYVLRTLRAAVKEK